MFDSFVIDPISEVSNEEYLAPLTTHPVAHTTNNQSAHSEDDSATLSTAAKARLWKQEGLTVAEISDRLGETISMVQVDLGLTASVAA